MARNDHPKKCRRKLFVVQGGLCFWCNRTCTMNSFGKSNGKAKCYSFTVDHVVPRGEGGHPKDWWNLVGACYECNQFRDAYLKKLQAGKDMDSYTSKAAPNPVLRERLINSIYCPDQISALPNRQPLRSNEDYAKYSGRSVLSLTKI